MQTKLSKLEQQFLADKDVHYRDYLIQLQYNLSTLYTNENPEYLEKIRDKEEWRDMELVRLRLAEEYQVNFINNSFKQEYEQTVENTKAVIEMVKTKLRDGLLNKIKQLKEDKALIDIVTSSKSGTVHTSTRSRNTLNDEDGSFVSMNSIRGNHEGGGYNTEDGNNNGNTSGFETSTSNFFFSGERRSRRKRNHDNALLHDSTVTNSNDDSYDSSATGGHSSRKKNRTNGNISSANEDEGKIYTENPILNEFLYGNKGSIGRKEKFSTRHTNRNSPLCPPLKPEEINEDLNLLRSIRRK
ncbi:Transcriptional regulatory protein SDS3 [Pichia kudriavzevii]|nr:Transcriptional regulatory protein SDS3 [Pichia kudriavzevii]